MPAYNPYAHQQGSGSQAHFNPSQASIGYDEPSYYAPNHAMYDDDNESTHHLAGAAAPFGHQSQYSVDRAYQHPQADYPGRTMTPATPTYDAYGAPSYPEYRTHSPAPSYGQHRGPYNDGKSGGGGYAV